MQTNTPPPSNAFVATICEVRKGNLTSDASSKLTELVQAVHATGKKGKLILSLDVSPSGDGESVIINGEALARIPKKELKPTTFFYDQDTYLLSRDNPRQRELELGVVEGGKASEPSAVAVSQ